MLLLPAAIVAIVVAHILLVRRHGVVPPFVLEDGGAPANADTTPASADTTPASAEAGGREAS